MISSSSSSMILSVLPFAHALLKTHLKSGDWAIDGTMGNGNDTLFLAQCVGENGRVLAFDIQDNALISTEKRLNGAGVLERVTLLKMGHELMSQAIPSEMIGRISAIVFNLGYLPRGDHNITTLPETTLQAIQSGLNCLKNNGLMVLVVYSGHQTGKTEAQSVQSFVQELPQTQFRVLKYDFINQKNNPPFVIAIQKLG